MNEDRKVLIGDAKEGLLSHAQVRRVGSKTIVEKEWDLWSVMFGIEPSRVSTARWMLEGVYAKYPICHYQRQESRHSRVTMSETVVQKLILLRRRNNRKPPKASEFVGNRGRYPEK